MIKAIGAAMIVVSCTGIGFRIARDFRERPRHLRVLMHAMRVLQAEIEYSVTPLPQALMRVADRTHPPVENLFKSAATLLQQGETSVEQAFEVGIESLRKSSALLDQDVDAIREFVRTLGASDRIHQSKQFEVTLSRLKGIEQDAHSAQLRHERLWQYVGVLAGLMLIVLLY
jgi:stage III sporulation protein AB